MGPKQEKSAPARVKPRLRLRYEQEAVKALMAEFGYENAMQVPKVVKVTLNMGLGEAVGNPNILKGAAEEMGKIAGQKPVITKAKQSIANFKLRAGLAIGCMVTLRRDRMWYFLDRLLNVAMPRIRDFKGVSPRSFDGKGNYNVGFTEQAIFPEVTAEGKQGLSLSIATTAKTDAEGRALLRALGMPFRT